jgi:hypothetical protein
VIRILAIIFPALGTASAAVFAFYGPQAEWSQASRTLANVTQLHGQMALGVWKLKCIEAGHEDNDVKLVIAALEEWSKRYLGIQTVSAATGTTNDTPAGTTSGRGNATTSGTQDGATGGSGKGAGGSGGQGPAPNP